MSGEIGKKLRHLRYSKDMTQAEFAEKVGIKRGTISNYEIGKRSPRLKELQKMADALGVGLDYFGISPTDEAFDLLTRAQEVFLSPNVPMEEKDELYMELMKLYLTIKE